MTSTIIAHYVVPVWRPEDVSKPVPAKPGSSELFRPDIMQPGTSGAQSWYTRYVCGQLEPVLI